MDKAYAIYARQSIDKPDSISIENQIERCIPEIQNSRYIVYSDRGYSGKNTDRPQFQAMLEAVRKGEIECVVCYKLDRCSRSILDFTQLMDLFQQYGVGFISCTEKFDTTTPMGRAMLNICIVFAQLERETIQQRITDAYHSRCRKGYFMGGRIPFGFSLIPYMLDGKKTSCYEVVESEASILKRIYSLYQNPTTSLSDVILALKAENISNPRRRDGIWVRPHIGRMIKNPIYVRADERIYRHYEKLDAILDNPIEDYIGYNGCYTYQIDGKQHLVLAPHKGIISSQVWLRCQKGTSGQKKSGQYQSPASWLTGKLKCEKCGRAVILRKSKGKNQRIYRYFVCSGAQGKDRQCEGFRAFSASRVEAKIVEAFINRTEMLSKREKSYHSDATISSQLGAALMNLATSCSASSIPLERLEQILMDMSQQMNAQRSDKEITSESPNDWKRVYTHLSQWEHLSDKKKARIRDLFISEVKLTDKRLTLFWRV